MTFESTDISVENPKPRTAIKIASVGFLVWFVPSMFLPQAVGMVVALAGIVLSLLGLLSGFQRQDAKKRETVMLGGFMALLWSLMLIFSFTAKGF
jgi:FtsH-binding integral membrane protein